MYYKVLNQLPKIPNSLIAKAISLYQDKDEIVSYRPNQYNLPNKEFPRFPVSNDFVDWIRTNITDKCHAIDIAVTGSSKPEINTMQPHTDRDREYTLMYLLQSGGDDHRTVFYEHKNKELVLKRQMNFVFEDLVEVDSIQIPLKTWTILNAQTIHGVKNIPGRRIAIQVALETNPWEN